MEKNLSEQLNIFLWSCAFGFCFGIIYDVFRFLRVLKFNSKIQIYIQDILFMCCFGLYTFLFTATYNFGEIRFYIVLGEFLGLISYRYTLGELTIRIFTFLYKIVITIFSLLEIQFKKLEQLIINIIHKISLKIHGGFIALTSKFKKANIKMQQPENQ